MPLLGDSTSVYVGATPITKVMAGEVEVWPKVPVIPGCYPPSAAIGFYSFEDNLKNSEGSAPDLQNTSLWPLSTYEFVDGPFGKCVQRGYSTNVSTDLQLEAEVTSPNRPLTLEAWFKFDDPIFKQGETVQMQISSGEFGQRDVNKMSIEIYNGSTGPTEGRIVCRFGHNESYGTIAKKLSDCGIKLSDQWFHAAISCDMDGTNGKAWINGKFFKATISKPFVPDLPLKKLGVRVLDADNDSHICFDEFRLSKELIYPDSDITPCSPDDCKALDGRPDPLPPSEISYVGTEYFQGGIIVGWDRGPSSLYRGFNVEYFDTVTCSWFLYVETLNTFSSCVIEKEYLNDFQTYDVRVSGVFPDGTVAGYCYTNIDSIVTIPDRRPVAPSYVSLQSSASGLTAVYDRGTSDAAGTISKSVGEIRKIGSSNWILQQEAAPEVSNFFWPTGSLEPAAEYQTRVSTFNQWGQGPWTVSNTVTSPS